MNWIDTGRGNVILYAPGKKFMISYRAKPHESDALFKEIMEPLADAIGVESPTKDAYIGETALVNDEGFRILRGDFRKDYEGLIEQGFEACKSFFESQEDSISNWTTPSLNPLIEG